MQTLVDELAVKGKAARKAARQLAKTTGKVKNQALLNIADGLKSRQEDILEANERDVDAGRQKGLPEYYLDRMMLNPERLSGIADDVRGVATLPDPVGEILEMRVMPNGLQVGRRRVPLGVVGVIYESRPNVTVDISTLCLKSGNAVILRGGSDTINSNTALANVIREAISGAGVTEDAVQLFESTDRDLVGRMLKAREHIDLLIPRGGQELINRVAQEASMPAITGGVGVCHTYVDREADLDKAADIVFNAKVQRYSVCNAMDTMIVHSSVAPRISAGNSRTFRGGGCRDALRPTCAESHRPDRRGQRSQDNNRNRRGLEHRVPGPDSRRPSGRFARRGAGAHRDVRLRPFRRDSDRGLLGGDAVFGRGGLQRRVRQLLHPIQRRRRARAGRGGRDQH